MPDHLLQRLLLRQGGSNRGGIATRAAASGGPGEASMPARLGIHSFRPNRRKGKRAG